MYAYMFRCDVAPVDPFLCTNPKLVRKEQHILGDGDIRSAFNLKPYQFTFTCKGKSGKTYCCVHMTCRESSPLLHLFLIRQRHYYVDVQVCSN